MADSPPPPPPAKEKSTLRKLALPIGLSVATMVVLGIFNYEPGTFNQMRFEPLIFLGALVVLAVQYVFGAFRLRTVTHERMNWTAAFRAQLIWDFASFITPSAIGGGPWAAAYIARDQKIAVGEVSGIMLFAMFLDQLWTATAILIVIGGNFFFSTPAFVFGKVGNGIVLMVFLLPLLWMCFLGYATLFRPSIFGKAAQWLCKFKWFKRFEPRVQQETENLQKQSKRFRQESWGFFIKVYVLSASAWICRYGVLLMIAWSAVASIPALEFYLRSMAVTLMGLVMPTPGGTGGIEVLVAEYVLKLVPATAGIGILLVWRSLSYYLIIFIGLMLTTHHIQNHRRMKKQQADPAAPELHPISESPAPESP